MNTGLHQVLAGAAPHDAITNHALIARDVLRGMGLRSEVFADASHLSRELPGSVLPHHRWPEVTSFGDRAILHYSIDSPAFDDVLAQGAVSAVHYHNVTPPELLWRDAPHIAWDCLRGRERLAHLASRVQLSAADSYFNAQELDDLGFPTTSVIGILRAPRATASALPDTGAGRPRVLFVGRGVPNKCQHDLVLAISALRDQGIVADLRLVGSWGSNGAYLDRCLRLADGCGVRDQVHILGSVDDVAIATEFARADVFVCLSEHEGYGVPLVEAMEAGLPIIAFGQGAVPETLGSAGLVLYDKSPSMVAEAITMVLNGALAQRMAAGRATQLATHSRAATSERLRDFAEQLLAC